MALDKRVVSVVASLIAVATACSEPPGQALDRSVDTTNASIGEIPDATDARGRSDFECPVTIPPLPGFDPPAPYADRYPYEGAVWYGTSDLWTMLSVNGDFLGGKMPLWWSVNFPGGGQEPQPDVRVSWVRLDSDVPIVIDGGEWTTNFHTPETGWAMMAGTYPPRDDGEPGIFNDGCWKVQATYKNATLSYVFELPRPDSN